MLVMVSTTRDNRFRMLGRMVPVMLGCFVFLNPMPYTTAIKEICFYGSLGIVLILAGFRKIDFSFRSPLTWPFILFTLWAVLGLVFALDRENSIHDFQTHWLKYLAFYYVLINVFNTRERLVWLSWVIVASSALFAAGLIVSYYVIQGHSLSARLVTGIPEIATNWVGIVTVPASIFAMHHLMTQERLAIRAVSLVCLFPLLMVSSLIQARATLLALFFAVIVLFFKNKKVLLGCVAVVLIFAVTTPIKDRFLSDDMNNRTRLANYYTNFEIIKDFPLMGMGFGMETYGNGKLFDLKAYYQRIPRRYQVGMLSDPHSMLFSVAVRTGLIGLGLFLFILFVPFRLTWGFIRQGPDDWRENWGRCLLAAWASVLLIGFFEPFFSHFPEVVLFTLLAMITVMWKDTGSFHRTA